MRNLNLLDYLTRTIHSHFLCSVHIVYLIYNLNLSIMISSSQCTKLKGKKFFKLIKVIKFVLVGWAWLSSHTVKMLTFNHDTKANFSQLQLSFLFPIQLHCQLPQNSNCGSVMSYKLIVTLSEISRIWHKSEKFSRARFFKCWIALSTR